MSFQIKLSVASLALAASFATTAATIDFTGGAGNAPAFNQVIGDGTTMAVSGTRKGRDANITMNRGGLGVKGGVNHFQSWGRETMTFSFTSAVRLNSLTFDSGTWNDWTGKDQFRYTDSSGFTTILKGGSNYWELGADNITSFTLSAVGNWTSSFVSAVDVEAVPLPASAWMFGSALLGLAGMARRKVKK
ncbi:putative secreted protein [Sinobacterium caligoides]|uniref:Putative secreted protein n=1 Tax=Sinobacterium caligoides TaxID=933926 RepID=A0A3N2E0Y7_9GAMM|nr:VPLPA-CTERM sorting domain-containing protein [Sinobacterium caligoides]ROS05299.1 putative secreted protein [Sinobacterium caligoides]